MESRIVIKRIVRILICIIISIFLFIHLTYIFREPLSHTREHLCGFYSEEKNTVDVAIIGTSCTFSAIAPMKMWEDHGIAAYNFCTNVMLGNTMRYAMKEIEKTQSPKLYIIDIASFMNGYVVTDAQAGTPQDNQILRYNTDGFRLSLNRLDLINEVVLDRKKRINYYLDLLYYHSNPNPEPEYWNYDKASAYKGYSNLQVDVMFDEKYSAEDYEIQPVSLSLEEMEILDSLLICIQEQKARVLFIVGPYWRIDKTEEARIKAAGKALFIKDYLKEKGYDFLDLHEHIEEIGMNGAQDYSMDYNHYTITGALKNTQYLGSYIMKEYDLPDRRNDAGYDKWRSEYKEWTETILPDNIAWTERLRQEYIDNHN
ncbi:MAG: hypothetical protein K6E98_09125 [Lachnospiraceae bacterium]|nr:hypothetical protein [Lachnospiraceae bacterium]